MGKEHIIKILKTVKIKNIFKRSGIEHLRLFGSYATDKANKQSDIDLLYEYNPSKDKSL
jgi:predicted nucleotidyltransferase